MRTRLRLGRDRPRTDTRATATEVGLIAPLLIIVFFGLVQVGLAMHRGHVIEAAALEAAQVASRGGVAEEVVTAGKDAAPGFLAGEVEVDTSDLCVSSNDETVVTVSTTKIDRLSFELPVVGSYRPTYSATATLPCERAIAS